MRTGVEGVEAETELAQAREKLWLNTAGHVLDAEDDVSHVEHTGEWHCICLGTPSVESIHCCGRS